MLGALKLKDQLVALAASQFWSGIVHARLDENDELRSQKIQSSMDEILPALLDCCIMTNADKLAELPFGETDISHVDVANGLDLEDQDEDQSDDDQRDNYSTLRKASSFALQ